MFSVSSAALLSSGTLFFLKLIFSAPKCHCTLFSRASSYFITRFPSWIFLFQPLEARTGGWYDSGICRRSLKLSGFCLGIMKVPLPPQKNPSNWLRELKKRKKKSLPWSLKLKQITLRSFGTKYILFVGHGGLIEDHTHTVSHILSHYLFTLCPYAKCPFHNKILSFLSIFNFRHETDVLKYFFHQSLFDTQPRLSPPLPFFTSVGRARPKSGGTLLFFDRVWVSHHRQHCCFSE